MTYQIEKMTTALSPAADRVLDSVAKAISDTPSAPLTALDRYQASRKAIQIKTGTQAEVAQTLMALGVYRGSEGATLALLASGHRVPTSVLDTALTSANVPTLDRIALKAALEVHRFPKLPK